MPSGCHSRDSGRSTPRARWFIPSGTWRIEKGCKAVSSLRPALAFGHLLTAPRPVLCRKLVQKLFQYSFRQRKAKAVGKMPKLQASFKPAADQTFHSPGKGTNCAAKNNGQFYV